MKRDYGCLIGCAYVLAVALPWVFLVAFVRFVLWMAHR